MKKNDALVLTELRKNSRKKISDMSRSTDIPMTTVFQTLQRVDKYIKKYTTLYDFGQIKYPIQIFYYIRLPKDTKIDKFLMENHFVNSLYRSNDGKSYLFDTFFKNIKDQHGFEEQLDDYTPLKISKHEIIEVISREEFLTDPSILFED